MADVTGPFLIARDIMTQYKRVVLAIRYQQRWRERRIAARSISHASRQVFRCWLNPPYAGIPPELHDDELQPLSDYMKYFFFNVN